MNATNTTCSVCSASDDVNYIVQNTGTTIVHTIQGSSALAVTINTAKAKFCPACGRRLTDD